MSDLKTIKKEAVKKLENIWYTKAGYQNEDLPLAYDDIVQLLSDSIERAGEEARREVLEKILKEGHGGGNWRRLIMMALTEPEKQENNPGWDDNANIW